VTPAPPGRGRRPSPRLALLDLDGTLVDSVPDLAWCVDRMLEDLGREPAGEARVRGWVGNGIDRLVSRALTGRLDGEAEPRLQRRARDTVLDLYAAHLSVRSRVYPGVEDGLAALEARGAILGCITNKPERHSEILLTSLGLRARFTLLLGGDSLPRGKPDPLPLRHAMRRFAAAPHETLLIGDSTTDVAAGRAAGVAVVCVSYGYNHGRDIREAHPDAVVDSLAELEDLLEPRPQEPQTPARPETM
jgi:phosphoglycolate phosphatase